MTVQNTFKTEDRHLIVISGELAECLKSARQLTKGLDVFELDEPKKANTILGQEFDAAIFHSHPKVNTDGISATHSFDANAFGAISGTIRCGGYLLLLEPQHYPKSSLFLQRFDRLLQESKGVTFIDSKVTDTLSLPKPSFQRLDQQSGIYANTDQQIAVEAILKVVSGHRRRPLVITSDRGRGKSAALGIAAAKLIEQDDKKIIICAPSKKIATIVFQHSTRLNQNAVDQQQICYFSPDDLQRLKPNADLILIDEAAAIPISILTDLLKHYARIVFASTQHGYEGSGRGFHINFKKVLDEQTPDWKQCHLISPIRWNPNDSLEAFTFKALMLDAEPNNVAALNIKALIENIKPADCHFVKLDKQALLLDERKLKSFFGLLVSAHYQTKPSDLMHLLDDEQTSIYCLQHGTLQHGTLQQSDHIIAVALVIREGDIDSALLPDIFAGKRRLKGHLAAQSLSVNVGIKSAPQLSGDRISRIAVHPELQNKGLGRYFLSKLVEASNANYVSSSFAVTARLLNFWQASEFSPVYLGLKRDASSGSHSVLVIHPKSKDGEHMLENAHVNFRQNFPHLLSDPLRYLEPDIAFSLLSFFKRPEEFDALDVEERDQLSAFANGFRGYENNLSLIWRLTLSNLSDNTHLTTTERDILILKIIQKNSWGELSKRMEKKVKGKKHAVELLKSAVNKLLN